MPIPCCAVILERLRCILCRYHLRSIPYGVLLCADFFKLTPYNSPMLYQFSWRFHAERSCQDAPISLDNSAEEFYSGHGRSYFPPGRWLVETPASLSPLLIQLRFASTYQNMQSRAIAEKNDTFWMELVADGRGVRHYCCWWSTLRLPDSH